MLRRQGAHSVTIKIAPSELRSAEEQNKLRAFSHTITDLIELPSIMADATEEMGLGKIGESSAFSRGVLTVEICGPQKPELQFVHFPKHFLQDTDSSERGDFDASSECHFMAYNILTNFRTLVDLPGLIHITTKSSNEADKDIMFDLVQRYMKNRRSIILAVISAKNDVAKQIILDLPKKIDKDGLRTLGIITKPDCMSEEDTQFWFDLALNKEVFLERGWHMVKNRSESESGLSAQERNDAEKVFLSQGRFEELPRDWVGIDTLRTRLNKPLHQHLVQELPVLKQEMTNKLQEIERQMTRLGDKRETPMQQRMMIMKVSLEVRQILSCALDGYYHHPFFGGMNVGTNTSTDVDSRRFRAVIEASDCSFEKAMRYCGHKYRFRPDNSPRPLRQGQKTTQHPQFFDRSDFTDSLSLTIPLLTLSLP